MDDSTFYNALRSHTHSHVNDSFEAARALARKHGSPIRAMCIEYGDDAEFIICGETERAFRARDESAATYVLMKPGQQESLTRTDVATRVKSGKLSSNDKLRRAGSYREFRVAQLFPALFDLGEAPSTDLQWEYLVGDFDIVATTPEYAFAILEQYWSEYLDGLSDSALERFYGGMSGKGESVTFRRTHKDRKFFQALSAGILDAAEAVRTLPLTDDFIFFTSFAESYFDARMVVIDRSGRFRTQRA